MDVRSVLSGPARASPSSRRPTPGGPWPPTGVTGRFNVLPSDKHGRDNRRRGTLRYVGERYARFAGTGEYFIQTGAQSPENFLAYYEFDGTADHGGADNRLIDGLHRYEPHVRDWRPGDPTWRGGKGKGIIGALNYLASEGMNTFYSLTMNVGGDGREIYPWTSYDERAATTSRSSLSGRSCSPTWTRSACSSCSSPKRRRTSSSSASSPPLRKLYYRELIARFATTTRCSGTSPRRLTAGATTPATT